MKTVAMLLFSREDVDYRVWKEARSLSKRYDVTIVMGKRESQSSFEDKGNFIVYRIFDDAFPTSLYPHKRIAAIKTLYRFFKDKHFDLYHCHDAPTLPFGYRLAKRDNAKLIYDAHDVFFKPRTKRSLKYNIAYTFARMGERKYIGKADAVITVSGLLAQELKRVHRLERTPLSILNTREYTEVKKCDFIREQLGLPDESIILFFQGGYSPSRGIERMVKIAHLVGKPFVLALAGPAMLERFAGGNVFYLGFLEPEYELLEATASADIGFYLPDTNDVDIHFSLPNKFFDFILAELPMVVSDAPEMKKFVEKYGFGAAVDPNDTDAVVSAVKRLAFDRNFYNLVKRNMHEKKHLFCWENEEKKLLELYERVLGCAE